MVPIRITLGPGYPLDPCISVTFSSRVVLQRSALWRGGPPLECLLEKYHCIPKHCHAQITFGEFLFHRRYRFPRSCNWDPLLLQSPGSGLFWEMIPEFRQVAEAHAQDLWMLQSRVPRNCVGTPELEQFSTSTCCDCSWKSEPNLQKNDLTIKLGRL